MMKTASLLFALCASSNAFGQQMQVQPGMVSVPMQEYMQMMQANQQGCFTDLSNTVNDGLSSKFEAYSNRTEILLAEATRRYEAAKDCRNDLLEDWQQWQKKQAETKAAKALYPYLVRRAELEYRQKLLQVEVSCRKSSYDQWMQYKASAPKLINDPTRAVSYEQTLNAAKDAFFNACIRNNDQLNQNKLMEADLLLKVEEMNAKIQVDDENIRDFRTQVEMVQSEKLRNCQTYQEDLLKYQEQLSKQLAEKAVTKVKQEQLLGTVANIANCIGMMTGRGLASPGDTTTTSDQYPTQNANF